jgi:hypothetical protein
MGVTNELADAVAARGGEIAGMRGASGKPVDTIPATPYFVVASNEGELLPGSWETLHYDFTTRCYLARTKDDKRTQTEVNDLLDEFIAAFRRGVVASGLTCPAIVHHWDTETFDTVGEEEYQALELVIRVTLRRAANYSAT